MRKSRRSYDKALKQEAVRLLIEEGRKPVEVERNLGIGKGTVGRWVKEFTTFHCSQASKSMDVGPDGCRRKMPDLHAFAQRDFAFLYSTFNGFSGRQFDK